MNELFCLGGAAEQDVRLVVWGIKSGLLFGVSNQAELHTEYPGQVGLLSFLCKWAVPLAGISVHHRE